MNSKKLGIIGAMDCEIETLTNALENRTTEEKYGYTFHKGNLNGSEVIIVKCGIGKVNAARGTQLLIDLYSPAAIINTGIAGGVGPEMDIGDAVIATGLAQHDFDVSPLGYAKGYMFEGATDTFTVYEPDEEISGMLTKAAKTILPEEKVKRGMIVSGDQFIASTEKRAQLNGDFGALAAEMEGASIAQVSHFAGIPFSVLRVMSDKGDGTASGNYAEFEKATAVKSSAIISEFAKLFA